MKLNNLRISKWTGLVAIAIAQAACMDRAGAITIVNLPASGIFQPAGTLTTFRDSAYESVFDSNGSLVTGTIQPGDTIQGMFNLTVSETPLSTNLLAPGNFQLSGIFSLLVRSTTAIGSGNAAFTIVPDPAFATRNSLASGAMFAIYQGPANQFNAASATFAGAMATATSNSTVWQVFGSSSGSSGTGWGANYYWAAVGSQNPGTSSFAGSLQLLTNNTGISSSLFASNLTQQPPAGFGPQAVEQALASIQNTTAMQGNSLSNSSSNIPFEVTTEDPIDEEVLPPPATLAWNSSTGGNWSSSGSWNGSRAPGGNPQDIASFGSIIGSNTATITLGGSYTIGGLSFSTTGGGRYVLSRSATDTTSTLTLAGSGASFPLGVAGGNQVIAVPLLLDNNLAVTETAGSALTISTSLGQAGGNRSLTLAGGGTLTLSGTDAYTGATIVEAGELIVTSPSGIFSGTSLIVGGTGAFYAPIIDNGYSADDARETTMPVPEPPALVTLAAAGTISILCRRRQVRRRRGLRE